LRRKKAAADPGLQPGSGRHNSQAGYGRHARPMFISSWPGLTRPSIFLALMDARLKAGHDE
jgi:hypothetical protein